MSIVSLIKSCPLFYELYDNEIMSIVDSCRVINLKPGDKIFSEGDMGEEIYLILSGSAIVKKGDLSIAILRQGDLFGEMVLLKENIRHADIVSDNYTDVLVVSYHDIFGLYETDKNAFSIIMLNLARLLAGRLRKAGESILELKQESYKKAS